IEDILEILSIPLLGVIPESLEVLHASNIGSPVTLSNTSSAPARAYMDAAKRLKGETVAMTIPSDKKGLLDRLFGRRAAGTPVFFDAPVPLRWHASDSRYYWHTNVPSAESRTGVRDCSMGSCASSPSTRPRGLPTAKP